ncbi:MAG: GNAT family N-acetyltransferase [Clostridia bacterium]|nr:GNAT family N-acetyltransferase [Clostridia bacterium]
MEFIDTSFLESDEVKLVLERAADADPVRKWVPAYYFGVCDKAGNRMGSCDLRVGYSEGLFYGGHIGYAIDEGYRGHHYAAKACELLFELARRHGMDHLFITCDPGNHASRKTCERLHGTFLGIKALPEDNDMRVNDGETEKCVFRFDL